MFKRLILLMLLLDGLFLSSYDTVDNNYTSSNINIPETEVFLLNDSGENMVDSVVTTYNKSGAQTHQWIYYRDGSVALFNDYLDIVNLELRIKYIEYKNSHDLESWKSFKEQAQKIVKISPYSYNIDYLTDLYCFNDYLRHINRRDLILKGYNEYLVEILSLKTNKKLEDIQNKIQAIIAAIILSLIGILNFLIIRNTDIQFNEKTEDTS